jgi:hypothetical protein
MRRSLWRKQRRRGFHARAAAEEHRAAARCGCVHREREQQRRLTACEERRSAGACISAEAACAQRAGPETRTSRGGRLPLSSPGGTATEKKEASERGMLCARGSKRLSEGARWSSPARRVGGCAHERKNLLVRVRSCASFSLLCVSPAARWHDGHSRCLAGAVHSCILYAFCIRATR